MIFLIAKLHIFLQSFRMVMHMPFIKKPQLWQLGLNLIIITAYYFCKASLLPPAKSVACGFYVVFLVKHIFI